MSHECTERIHCSDCGSEHHTTALHVKKENKSQTNQHSRLPVSDNSGEFAKSTDKPSPLTSVKSKYTEIGKDQYRGKSCAKILPVDVFNKSNPNETVRMYAIIDDQSNRSLASPDFFRIFNITDRRESYSLSTCAGQIVTSG